MSRRIFGLASCWCWDHSNDQFATFTIEGDADDEYRGDPVPADQPLDPLTFQKYFEKYRITFETYIRQILAAQDGSVMGKIRPFALYEVRRDDINIFCPLGDEIAKVRTFIFDTVWLCNFDEDGKPKFDS